MLSRVSWISGSHMRRLQSMCLGAGVEHVQASRCVTPQGFWWAFRTLPLGVCVDSEGLAGDPYGAPGAVLGRSCDARALKRHVHARARAVQSLRGL
eukprot:985067-Pyramimonas_sp.AAC.1